MNHMQKWKSKNAKALLSSFARLSALLNFSRQPFRWSVPHSIREILSGGNFICNEPETERRRYPSRIPGIRELH